MDKPNDFNFSNVSPVRLTKSTEVGQPCASKEGDTVVNTHFLIPLRAVTSIERGEIVLPSFTSCTTPDSYPERVKNGGCMFNASSETSISTGFSTVVLSNEIFNVALPASTSNFI